MERSGSGPRSVAQLLPRLTRATLGRRGFAEAGLVADWAAIAGGEIAAHCQPERLEFPRGERLDGTLHLRVEGAWGPALLHLEPQLVERINGSLGYRAVGRLKLHQGPLPKPASRAAAEPLAPPLPPAEQARLAAETSGIADPDLRRAVTRLGEALLGRGAQSPAAQGPARRGGKGPG